MRCGDYHFFYKSYVSQKPECILLQQEDQMGNHWTVCTNPSCIATEDHDDNPDESDYVDAYYTSVRYNNYRKQATDTLKAMDVRYNDVLQVCRATTPAPTSLQRIASERDKKPEQALRRLRKQTAFSRLRPDARVIIIPPVDLGHNYVYYHGQGRVVGDPHQDGSYTVEILHKTYKGKAWVTVPRPFQRHDLIKEELFSAAVRAYKHRYAAYQDGE